MMKKLIIILFAIFIFPSVLLAQQSNTMFYMHKVPQSNFVNPAIRSECKVHVGGAIVPFFGQVFLPVHINYSNNSFGYSDIFRYGTGAYSDSLVHPFHPNAYESGFTQEFLDRMRQQNFINFEMHLNLLNLGINIKDYYLTFNITEKADARFGFSKDFIEFLAKGNQDAYGRTLNMGWLGLNAKHYREYSLGAQRKFGDKLHAGAHVKWLFGKANLQTTKNDIKLRTNPISWSWMLETDMQMSTSSPFFDVTNYYYDYETDSLVFETDSTLDVEIQDYMLNRKNYGFALDLGAIYDLTDRISIHASLLDLGFIRWRDHPETFTSQGRFTFHGLSINEWYEDQDAKIDSIYSDSLMHLFEPVQNQDPYNTWLTAKVNVGGTYQLHEKLTVGGLYHAQIYNNSIHSAVILSANSNITNWLSASLNYSIINNTYTNVGLGLYIRGSIFQFFFITDNVMAPFLPEKTRNINFRMGSNLAFGCKKKEEKVMF